MVGQNATNGAAVESRAGQHLAQLLLVPVLEQLVPDYESPVQQPCVRVGLSQQRKLVGEETVAATNSEIAPLGLQPQGRRLGELEALSPAAKKKTTTDHTGASTWRRDAYNVWERTDGSPGAGGRRQSPCGLRAPSACPQCAALTVHPPCVHDAPP